MEGQGLARGQPHAQQVPSLLFWHSGPFLCKDMSKRERNRSKHGGGQPGFHTQAHHGCCKIVRRQFPFWEMGSQPSAQQKTAMPARGAQRPFTNIESPQVAHTLGMLAHTLS